jgi:hypothetical protein
MRQKRRDRERKIGRVGETEKREGERERIGNGRDFTKRNVLTKERKNMPEIKS